MVGALAEALGDNASAARLYNRSRGWRALLQPTAQGAFMRGKRKDGSWAVQTSPFERQSWVTEATPLQYTFFVPHDVPGLADAMGGPKQLVAQLDLLLAGIFNKSVDPSLLNYDAGNEPDIQAGARPSTRAASIAAPRRR